MIAFYMRRKTGTQTRPCWIFLFSPMQEALTIWNNKLAHSCPTLYILKLPALVRSKQLLFSPIVFLIAHQPEIRYIISSPFTTIPISANFPF